MRTSLDDGDRLVLQRLQQSGGTTIPELCEELQVTATAVRQRLTRLQDFGMIDRATVRSGRGRPHHAYVITDAGRHELGDNYGELALLLWEEVRQIDEPVLRNRILGRVQQQMAERFGVTVRGRTIEQRMQQLRKVLQDRGFSVEIAECNGLPVLREHHCPYHELAMADAGICQLEQRVFEQVLGVPLTLSQCCRDGHGSCEFHVDIADPAASA